LTITTDQIESVAPDQASLSAASKLLKRAKWPLLEQNSDGTVLWGQCQGSGSTPYSMAVAVHDLGAKCSCPSRKFPCKHSIALMWWFTDNPSEFSTGDTPEWVSQWLSRRRGSSSTAAEGETKTRISMSDAAAEAAKPVKKISAAEQQKIDERASRQKERNKAKREASILQGLDELDRWIIDQIEEGFAGFETRAQEQVPTLVKRLVDAKAPGLALRVEATLSAYYSADYSDRNNLLIENFGMLHLLANAYRQQTELPDTLQADVRQAVGWTIERDGLLKDATAKRITGKWIVTGVREETQTDRTIRQETWLLQQNSDEPAVAVLIDYVPVSSGAGRTSLYRSGQSMSATVVYYPSSTPLRAIMVEPTSHADSACAQMPVFNESAGQALTAFYSKRTTNPWLAQWPVSMAKTIIQRSNDEKLWVTDREASVAIMVKSSDVDKTSVLLGLDDLTVHGLFDGRQIELLAASTPLGAWWSSDL